VDVISGLSSNFPPLTFSGTSNSGCDYLIQQNLAAKLFQEAVAKGATARDTLYDTMAPRPTDGEAGNQVSCCLY
jgi:hypothetical protein